MNTKPERSPQVFQLLEIFLRAYSMLVKPAMIMIENRGIYTYDC